SAMSFGGDGIHNEARATLILVNTIIANSANQDCFNTGTMGTEKNNLIEKTGAAACGLTHGANGDIIGFGPMLGTLAYHGGDTKSFALLAGSPAIDAGDDATCVAPPVNNLDQRGFSRPL